MMNFLKSAGSLILALLVVGICIGLYFLWVFIVYAIVILVAIAIVAYVIKALLPRSPPKT